LLDTHALIWVLEGHRRSRTLNRAARRLYVSPVSVLEIQMLDEIGRLRLRHGALDLSTDPRLLLDDPSSAALFESASAIGWTQDPFDRLIVAHARLRDWTLATADSQILSNLAARDTLEL
jgi:PIN domain nuclease of toxin-antitoxin system